jgi:hypothetical protein
MKNLKFPLIAVFITALFTIAFIGCKKDSLTPSVTSDAKGGGGAPGAPVTAPYTNISFNPNPGVVGQPFTATVSLDPVADCGYVELDQAQDILTGDPAPMAAVAAGTATWVNVASVTLPGTLPLTYTYTPTVAGQVGYRAHYEPRGGQCGYTGRPAVAVDATIGGDCTEGLSPQLAGAVPLSTDAKGTTWQFTVVFHLNTCTNGFVGKLQGGLISGSTVVSASPLGYTTSSTAKSNVLTWSNVSDGDYTVTYTVHLAPGQDIPITGAWSFKYPGGQYGYTDRVLFSF